MKSKHIKKQQTSESFSLILIFNEIIKHTKICDDFLFMLLTSRSLVSTGISLRKLRRILLRILKLPNLLFVACYSMQKKELTSKSVEWFEMKAIISLVVFSVDVCFHFSSTFFFVCVCLCMRHVNYLNIKLCDSTRMII
jgi:hypothetical protein